ncbi:MAG: hypothetical protein ABEL76_12965, partial [Bradymonadaceae bacterium]
SSESLRQTLELLGELVVRPIVGDDEEGGDDLDELQWAERDEDWIESGDFPLEPTRQLDEATVDRAPADNEAARALWDRFEELGFSPDTDPLPERPLFRQVSWTPEDARTDGEADTTMGDHDAEDRRRPGALEFRSVLNEEARHLFHFDRLREVREGTTGPPPRLNIYVVADMGEPFARTVTRTVLREIHAELLRAYGPLFESYREGFDRTLAIHPILWTPHPADAFGGRYPVENRCEEAAIIESIQGIRRWVESVPRGTRCIPQVFVNSRVTDNAVLGRRDAVEETVDFLSFQMRNRLGEDPWLRRAASGSPGTDLFATFSCREIEFPAIEAREYLANRLARMSLAELDAGDPGESPSLDREAIEAPDAAELEGEGRDRIRQRTRQEAEDCEDRVQQRLDIGFDTTTAEIEGAFDESYEATLVRRIHDRWRSITRDRGLMDEVVDDLRTRSTKELGELLEEIREVGDRLVEEYASEGDLGAAKAGFNELTRWSGDELREAERQRREGERECLENSEPTMDAVESARRAVAAAAPDKPRGSAMRTAELAWLLMCPAMGAPISWAVALYTGMPSSPGPLEFVFGPLGYLVGGLVLYALGRYLMRRHMANRIEEIQSAIDRLAESAGEVVDGSGASVGGRTSIRSFVEARLGYAGRLAARNYARRVYERVARDDQLAQRIYRSIDVQREHLLRRAEALGVRVEMGDGAEGEDEEDLSELFGGRGERGRPSLLDPEILDEYFRSRTGGRFSVRRSLPTFIDRAGGFDNWRRTAVLSDTDRLMDYGRERFSELVDRPVADQMAFGERAGDRIVEFARDVYPNLGFAAKFSGYEGMDPDGIDIVADSALVLNPKLRGVFERARQRNDVEAETETLDVIEAGVDPNAAYMLSLASGLRPHSIQNLLRHESYTDRGDMPDDRTFPLSGEPPGSESPSPINHLTGHDELRDSINEPILREFQRGRAQLGAVPSGVRAAREAASRSAEEIDGKEGEGESAAEEGGNDGTADTSEASGDGAASELDRSVSDDDAAEGTDRAGTDEETPGADERDGESTDAADGPGGDETGADAGRTVDRGESNLGGADTDGTPIGKIDLKPPPSLGESSQDGDESAQEREGGGESESDPGETTDATDADEDDAR